VPGLSAPMLVLFAASQTTYLLVAGVVGVRLLLLARRTGQRPELWLGLHFLLCLTIGYVLFGTGLGAAAQPGTLPAPLVAPMVGVGQFVSSLGVLANIVFTWLVFRRDDRWALALLVLCGLGLLLGHVGWGLEGGFSTSGFVGAWFWLNYGTMIVGACWAAAESLAYWLRMRRRRAIGLADPVVTDRFWLWGVGSLARLGMLLSGAASQTMIAGRTGAELSSQMASVLTTTSIFGVVVSVSFWLAFFPPRAYLARIAGREAAR
jgi:hypothetical protein